MLFNLLFLVLKESLSVHCVPLDLVNWGVFSVFYFFFVHLPVFMQGEKKNSSVKYRNSVTFLETTSHSNHKISISTCANGNLYQWQVGQNIRKRLKAVPLENLCSSPIPTQKWSQSWRVFCAAGAPNLVVILQKTSTSTSVFNFLLQSLAFTVQAISLTLYLSSNLYLAGT